MNENDTTICDACGREIHIDHANQVDGDGEWFGATLCGDCYADLVTFADD